MVKPHHVVGVRMDKRDWGFALDYEFGNPLADIKEWMVPLYPAWMPDWQRKGELHAETEGAIRE